MKTVQMTLDEALLQEVDRVVARVGSTRSAFTREALRHELRRIDELELEQRHREGYSRHPVESDEFADWEGEQVWPS